MASERLEALHRQLAEELERLLGQEVAARGRETRILHLRAISAELHRMADLIKKVQEATEEKLELELRRDRRDRDIFDKTSSDDSPVAPCRPLVMSSSDDSPVAPSPQWAARLGPAVAPVTSRLGPITPGNTGRPPLADSRRSRLCLERGQPTTSKTPQDQVQPSDFSSPLVCRVRKETLQHRREEVDIETGKRRSWVEEEEREVMDLTGDTPAKPKAVFKPVELPPAADSAASRPSTVTLPSSLPSSPYTLAPLSLPSSPCSPVDESTCPVCRREFSGARGVAAHRRHKNSKCKPGDQAQEPTKSSAVPVPATTAASTAAPAATTTATTATTATAAQEVITIPDTPETPATPATRATRDTRATRTPATPASTRTRRSLGLRLR